MNEHDIIIIGSGMAGLYTAFKIKKETPTIKLLILEKSSQSWMGGRTGNSLFHGATIVRGAGIGRNDTNPLLISLLKECNVTCMPFRSVINYSPTYTPIDIMKIVTHLKSEYKKHPNLHSLTFRDFFLHFYNSETYTQFLVTSGYRDYENADTYETLYNYGFDDTIGGWSGFYVPWSKLVKSLYDRIGHQHFRFSQNVVSIKNTGPNYEIVSENGTCFISKRVILATPIASIHKLIPENKPIYDQIHGQPFFILYGKFNKLSSKILQELLQGHYTVVPNIIQKIIPMNTQKGVYMIVYNDNDNAVAMKRNKRLDNTFENREYYCRLIEQGLKMESNSLKLQDIKGFYWDIGTHYFEPLCPEFRNRNDFLRLAQRPKPGVFIVGEAVSRYQGWVEGALESVESVWGDVKQCIL